MPELLRQLDRLASLRALGAGTINVETIPAGRMNALARYGLAGKASALQGLSGQRRGATLLCAVRGLTADVADDLCDALDAIVVERVVRKAARESTAARLRSLPACRRHRYSWQRLPGPWLRSWATRNGPGRRPSRRLRNRRP